MKIVYHERFTEVYTDDPAAAPGRMESIYDRLVGHFEFVRPEFATVEDLKLVHSDSHIRSIRLMGLTYEIALLAAGGAIKASELAVSGEPAFALIRPPGHHASRDKCWGFCFFNNMAASLATLRAKGEIGSALVLDFDLHFGDGTHSIFGNTPGLTYFHPKATDRRQFVKIIEDFLSRHKADIIAVSAGFDRHESDWGGMLTTTDYETIGKLAKQFAEDNCQGRRYGVLEGGYNHAVLGDNVKALLDGMK